MSSSLPGPQGIIELAQSGGSAWQEFFNACFTTAREGTVRIHSVGEAIIEPDTGQRVRAIKATINHPEGLTATIVFHIGVQGDEVFTGYGQPELWDYYELAFPNGPVYASRLWWVEEPDENVEEPSESTLIAQLAWHAVSPLKMAVWWATYARLLDGRALVDDPNVTI
jgi:hypothetical protein